MPFEFSLDSSSITEGDSLRILLTSTTAIPTGTMFRWEIIPQGLLPITFGADGDFMSRSGVETFTSTGGETEFTIPIPSVNNGRDAPPKDFAVRVYEVKGVDDTDDTRSAGDDDDVLIGSASATLMDDDSAVARRDNLSGDGNNNILELGGLQTVTADGFRDDDLYVVSRFQYGDATIGDGFGTNTIRFAAGVEIINIAEDSTDVRDDPTLQNAFGSGRPTTQDLLDNFIITDASEVITYNSVTYTLSTGGTVTIDAPATIVAPAAGETPAVLRYLFQIGNGEAKGYLDFRDDIKVTNPVNTNGPGISPTEDNPFVVGNYGAVPDSTPSTRGRTDLAGEASDDVLTLSGEFQTRADGLRGNDYFVISRYLSGAMTIDDGFGTNTIRFDDGVKITAVIEDTTDVRDDPTLQDEYRAGRPTTQDLLDNSIITDASEVITYNSVTYTLSTGGTVTIVSPTTIVVPATGETPAVLRYLFQIGDGEAKSYLDFRDDIKVEVDGVMVTPNDGRADSSAATAAFVVAFDNEATATLSIAYTEALAPVGVSVGETLTVSVDDWVDADDTDGMMSTPEYQWYANGILINGATSASYLTAAPGQHRVEVTTEDDEGGTTVLTASIQVADAAMPLSGESTLTTESNEMTTVTSVENDDTVLTLSSLVQGAAIDWSLTESADSEFFIITEVGDTGVITWREVPDFESTTSMITYDHLFRIEAVATDDDTGDIDRVLITIELTDAPDAPVITSGTALELAENTETGAVVATLAARDDDGGAFTWALSGDDDNLFAIDVASGEITWTGTALLDFETASDRSFSLRATVIDDTGLPTSSDFTITLTDVNEAPIIDQGENLRHGASENSQTLTILTARDDDASDTLRWSLEESGDYNLFTIDEDTGAIRWRAVPDFESTVSSSSSNNKEFIITAIATDGSGLTDSVVISVTLNDAFNEVPVLIDSSGRRIEVLGYAITAPENRPLATTLTAVDDDVIDANGVRLEGVVFREGAFTDSDGLVVTDGAFVDVNGAVVADAVTDPITWELLKGKDGDLFTLGEETGELRWKETPDFETLTSSNGNKIFTVFVRPNNDRPDTTLTGLITTVEITLTDENEAPVISTIVESFAGRVAHVNGLSDSNGPFHYTATIVGTSSGIDISAGGKAYLPDGRVADIPPGMHTITPRANNEDSYIWLARAADGTWQIASGDVANNGLTLGTYYVLGRYTPSTDTFTYAGVEVTPPETLAIEITGNIQVESAEDQDAVTTLSATDVDADENGVPNTLSWSLAETGDHALFTIDEDTGEITWSSTPNFESTTSAAGGDHVFMVTAIVSDGTTTDDIDLIITLTDENDAPVIGVRRIEDFTGRRDVNVNGEDDTDGVFHHTATIVADGTIDPMPVFRKFEVRIEEAAVAYLPDGTEINIPLGTYQVADTNDIDSYVWLEEDPANAGTWRLNTAPMGSYTSILGRPLIPSGLPTDGRPFYVLGQFEAGNYGFRYYGTEVTSASPVMDRVLNLETSSLVADSRIDGFTGRRDVRVNEENTDSGTFHHTVIIDTTQGSLDIDISGSTVTYSPDGTVVNIAKAYLPDGTAVNVQTGAHTITTSDLTNIPVWLEDVDMDGIWEVNHATSSTDFARFGRPYYSLGTFDSENFVFNYLGTEITPLSPLELRTIILEMSIESIENEQMVTTILASDADAGDTPDSLSWSLEASDASATDYLLFTINENTGALTWTNTPDFETFSSSAGSNVFSITVVATDDSGASGRAELTVTLMDEIEDPAFGRARRPDDTPDGAPALGRSLSLPIDAEDVLGDSFTQPIFVVDREDLAVGELVGTLIVIDNDLSGLTWAIVASPVIDPNTGQPELNDDGVPLRDGAGNPVRDGAGNPIIDESTRTVKMVPRGDGNLFTLTPDTQPTGESEITWAALPDSGLAKSNFSLIVRADTSDLASISSFVSVVLMDKTGTGAAADTLDLSAAPNARVIQGGALDDTITASAYGDTIAGGYGDDDIALTTAHAVRRFDKDGRFIRDDDTETEVITEVPVPRTNKVGYRWESGTTSTATDGGDTVTGFIRGADQLVFVDIDTASAITNFINFIGYAQADGVAGNANDLITFAFSQDGADALTSIEIVFGNAGTTDGSTAGGADSNRLTITFAEAIDLAEQREIFGVTDLSSILVEESGKLVLKSNYDAVDDILGSTTEFDGIIFADDANSLGFDII